MNFRDSLSLFLFRPSVKFTLDDRVGGGGEKRNEKPHSLQMFERYYINKKLELFQQQQRQNEQTFLHSEFFFLFTEVG